ncbi:hypothetical protein FACS189425_05500 [Clostridia bacterium]|nr:hypothetical protein FACS189425_05500 [Clostridia bacterium]
MESGGNLPRQQREAELVDALIGWVLWACEERESLSYEASSALGSISDGLLGYFLQKGDNAE